jgi:hypothetical protein
VRRRGEVEGGGQRMARWKRGAFASAQQRAGQPACLRGGRRGEVEDGGRHRARWRRGAVAACSTARPPLSTG